MVKTKPVGEVIEFVLENALAYPLFEEYATKDCKDDMGLNIVLVPEECMFI